MTKLLSILCALLAGLSLSPVSLGALSDAGENVIRQGELNDDYYAAGGQVTINAIVDGDIVVAGGDVSVDSQISGDLTAAGGSVTLRGRVADDLRVAGGELDLDVTVGDDLMAAGGQITISPDSTINGEVRLAGGDVSVGGTLNGGLTVAAGRLTISGRIKGDVNFIGDQIDLLDGAIIEGDLIYRSPDETLVNTNATINGNLVYQRSEWHSESGEFGFFFPFTMMLAGVLFLVLFPNYSVASASRIATTPLYSAGIGLLFLVFAPILAFLLMVTVVGIWVGLALLALYAVAILAGYLVGCIFIGDRGGKLLNQDLSSRWRRIVSLLLAIVLLALVSMLPLVGGLLIFILLLTGLGAGLLQLQVNYRQPL